MSAREFRPKRWEQKANVRPGKRARMFRYTQYDVDVAYETGKLRGTSETVKRHERRDDILFRLARAAEQGQDELEALARELDQEAEDEERRWWSDDDATALAREVGVLDGDEDKALWDSVPPHGSGMVVEIEQWLRVRGRWLDFLREQGDLPDDKDGGA